MRLYGDIAGVYFSRQGWSIYNLAYEYRLEHNGDKPTVYVNNMGELREEIRKIAGNCYNEQQAQVPSMQDCR